MQLSYQKNLLTEGLTLVQSKVDLVQKSEETKQPKRRQTMATKRKTAKKATKKKTAKRKATKKRR